MVDEFVREIDPKVKRQRGASLVEYTLLVALVAVITIGGVRRLGENISENIERSRIQISGASSLPCLPGFPGCP